jgi:hypothetical protein
MTTCEPTISPTWSLKGGRMKGDSSLSAYIFWPIVVPLRVAAAGMKLSNFSKQFLAENRKLRHLGPMIANRKRAPFESWRQDEGRGEEFLFGFAVAH